MLQELNYNILMKSEDKLLKEFQEYVDHSIKVHRTLWKILFKKERSVEDVEIIAALEDESNNMQRNMLEDTIWAISKNQPRASHLRYMIALIYSIKDIERLIDTAFEIFRTTSYTKDYKFADFKGVVKLYLDFMISLRPYMGDKYKENKARVKAEKKIFDEKFYEIVNQVSHNLKHQGMSSKIIYQCSSICKNINVSINYYLNSFYNFKYIKSSSSKTKKIDLKRMNK